MKTPPINPVHWRLDTLLSCGPDTIDGLARAAAGTLTSYRLLLGRCLLAMDEHRHFKKLGCSSSIHYATRLLGLARREALGVRRVARRLLELPKLSLAAETGTIGWSKLREIVRKASAKTEDYWLELARHCTYREVQYLVSQTPAGSIPGEAESTEGSLPTELRCPLPPEVFQLLDLARRTLSLEKGEAVTTAQVLEWTLSAYLAEAPASQEAVDKARQETDKDLAAERARCNPTVWQARELALSMGLLGPGEPPTEDEDLVSRALGLPEREEDGPARVQTDPEPPQTTPRGAARVQVLSWRGLKNESWENERLRFNPRSRHTTPGQKKELLRRQGHRCATPGCHGHLWLEVHHLQRFCEGGPTEKANLLCLCSRCHRNVHEGHLHIERNQEGTLVFSDGKSRRLDRTYDLDVAGWLDFWLGWSGSDSHSLRAQEGKWSTFNSQTLSTEPRRRR